MKIGRPLIMKIVHFESGLGNQMLNYAEFLAIKYNYSDVYSEKLVYETAPKGLGFSQWNGYELKKDFALNIPDIKDVLSKEQYSFIKSEMISSKYWENDWKYAIPFISAMNKLGQNIYNFCDRGTFGSKEKHGLPEKWLKWLCFHTSLGNKIYLRLAKKNSQSLITKNYKNLFIEYPQDFYCGQTLKFMYKGQGIEKIEEKLKTTLIFQNITLKNKEFAKFLHDSNSVSIHVRRGDFLSRNNFCYKYGFFKRSVEFMKKQLTSPILFVFFCSQEDIPWVKNNKKTFGLDNSDHIIFVDWNTNENSYQDMFLMSNCNNNIITQSSFGWWGAWLNNNPNKISISPDPRINTTHWM